MSVSIISKFSFIKKKKKKVNSLGFTLTENPKSLWEERGRDLSF